MYEAYWGLQRSVFSHQAAREALPTSPIHAEGLARLDFLRDSQSPFGLLLGPSGSGKSILLADFAERSARRGSLVCSVPATADQDCLFASLAAGLQLESHSDPSSFWQRIIDRLEELKLETLAAVVLFDDLDRGSPILLAAVDRLLAVSAPLTVVASARPETVGRLGAKLLEQAALRIDLAPWNERETGEYLATSLKRAGRLQPAFDDSATRRLFELSGGAPRRVNQLAQLALLAGAGQGLVQIDRATIDAVEEELSVAR
jgi:type II secretory pathway predicted ATPase ExeA